MELDYLKDFIAAAEAKDFGEISDQLFISQSTLYRHIQHLESDLGLNTPLFERTPKGMILNSSGEIFLKYAKRIVSLQEQAVSEIEEDAQNRDQTVKIACVDTDGFRSIVKLLKDFQNEYPGSRVRIMDNENSFNMELLQKGTCDAAFLINPGNLNSEDFGRIFIEEGYLTALVDKNRIPEDREEITLEELAEDPICTFDPDTAIGTTIVTTLTGTGSKPNIIFTSHRHNMIKNMAEQTGSTAIILSGLAETLHYTTVRPVKIIPEIKYTIEFWYNTNAAAHKTPGRLIDLIGQRSRQ